MKLSPKVSNKLFFLLYYNPTTKTAPTKYILSMIKKKIKSIFRRYLHYSTFFLLIIEERKDFLSHNQLKTLYIGLEQTSIIKGRSYCI